MMGGHLALLSRSLVSNVSLLDDFNYCRDWNQNESKHVINTWLIPQFHRKIQSTETSQKKITETKTHPKNQDVSLKPRWTRPPSSTYDWTERIDATQHVRAKMPRRHWNGMSWDVKSSGVWPNGDGVSGRQGSSSLLKLKVCVYKKYIIMFTNWQIYKQYIMIQYVNI